MGAIKQSFILLICFFFVSSSGMAATTPAKPSNSVSFDLLLKKISSMKVRDFQKLTGHKLTLKEKIGFGILKHKIKKEHKKEKERNHGKLALLFGIAGIGLLLLGLFIPFLLLPSLASAIVAIVVGSVAKKRNPDDRKAHAGKLLGWITLGLMTVVLLLGLIIISTWDEWFTWG